MHISADQFVDRPVPVVFQRLCEEYFAFQPMWDPAITEIAPLEGSKIAVGSRASITRTTNKNVEKGESVIIALEPSTGITVENRYPKNLEIRKISCHPLQGGGTRLHVEIDSEIHGFAKLIAPLVLNMLERALAYSLHVAKLAVEQADESEET